MYQTLRQMARRELDSRRNPNRGANRGANRGEWALDPTEIVHECYLKLSQAVDLAGLDRVGFIALAARVIRHTLVDQARTRGAIKRGGGVARVTLHEDAAISKEQDVDLLDLDEALAKLALLDERASRVVELRFFGGLTNEEAARVLEVSPRTVVDEWGMARAWLKRELSRGLQR
jgi:RNA polymerase sigma factor (TIGR02999 family)